MGLVPQHFYDDLEMDIDEGNLYGEQDERVIKMAVTAVREALGSIQLDQPVPLILAFPEPEDHDLSFPTSLVTNLLAQQDLPLAKELIRTLHTGRAGGIEALGLAQRYLYELQHDYVLVGASDSYFHCARLSGMALADRLLAPENMDGFAPGEGAGFLLLTRHMDRAMVRNKRIIGLLKPGMGEEKGHMHNPEETYTGGGLDSAFKMALSNHNILQMGSVYSSMNGEHYWSKEHGVAMMRNHRLMADDVEVEHPADCYGDIGAASGPVLTGLAANALLNKAGSSDQALVYCASEGAARAAVCLQVLSAQ